MKNKHLENIFFKFITIICLAFILFFSLKQNVDAATYDVSSGDVTLSGGTNTITGTTTSNKIIITGGTNYVTLNNANVDFSGLSGDTGAIAFDIQAGVVYLTLTGINVMKGRANSSSVSPMYGNGSGIHVASTSTIFIDGTGSITVSGTGRNSGIGGNVSENGGTIIINGGTITASGGAAGIGAGGYAGHLSITINGGTVTASAGGQSSAIGSAFYNNTAGTITITGGNITAYGYSSGIGGGDKSGAGSGLGGVINITGGTIYAKSSSSATSSGIGAGRNGDATSIANTTISISNSAVVHAYGIDTYALKAGTITATGCKIIHGIFASAPGTSQFDLNFGDGNDSITMPSASYKAFAVNQVTANNTFTMASSGLTVQDGGNSNLDCSSSVNNLVNLQTVSLPTVTTQAVTSITSTTATGNGNVTSLGSPSPTQHGHCWNTSTGPTTANNKTELGAKGSTGAFTSSITGLTPGDTYYVRAYAVNDGGTSYGNEVSFITIPDTPVSTASSNIDTSSFTANWNSSTGATGYYFDVSTSNTFSSFVTGYNNLDVGNVTTKSITGLTSYTTYYYRVRAYNATGSSSSSNVISDTTLYNGPVFYVNDNSTVNDSYCTVIGNDTLNIGNQIYPFSTINKAMLRAYYGCTIYIDAGTYSETVVISKNDLSLIGADSNLTIINPTGDSTSTTLYGIYSSGINNVTIKNIRVFDCYNGIKMDNCDSVTIDSVKVDYSGYTGAPWTGAGIYLLNGSDYNNITNVFLYKNYYGIHLAGSSYNNIQQNKFYQNSDRGIYFQSSSNNNIITGNRITGSNNGIFLYTTCDNNIFQSNLIYSNLQNGCYLFQSSDNRFYQNQLNLNSQYAFYMTNSSLNDTFEYNNISVSFSNSDSAFYNEVNTTYSCRYNYYGTNDSSVIEKLTAGTYKNLINFVPFRTAQNDTLYGADTIAPSTPVFNFIDTSVTKQVKLRWNKPSTDENGIAITGLYGYRIYRILQNETDSAGDTDNWENSIIAIITDANDTEYIDTSYSEIGNYYYRITAFDSHYTSGTNFQNRSWYSSSYLVNALYNTKPETPILLLPVNLPAPYTDYGTYGRTLNHKPNLLWQCPTDSDSTALHFQVYIDSGLGKIKLADSVNDTNGFYYYNSGNFETFTITGADSSVYGNTVYYTPQINLNDSVYAWSVIAYDSDSYSDTSLTRYFKIGGRTWTDSPLVAGITLIRKVHIDELREEVNFARNFRGLSDFIWTDPTIVAGESLIRKIYIDELRQAIEEYKSAGKQTAPSWFGNIIAGETLIKKIYFEELRNALEN